MIQYGISRDVPTTLQRGGRGGRSAESKALFLIMYEPWVKDIDLTFPSINCTSDPDHPNVQKLTIHSKKRDRTGVAMVMIVQNEEECLRGLFGNYFNDQSPNGIT